MYITSRCVHGSDEFFSIKPSVVPPNTPTTVRKVSKFDLTNRFHRAVGLAPVVAYELDILLCQRCRGRVFVLINLPSKIALMLDRQFLLPLLLRKLVQRREINHSAFHFSVTDPSVAFCTIWFTHTLCCASIGSVNWVHSPALIITNP